MLTVQSSVNKVTAQPTRNQLTLARVEVQTTYTFVSPVQVDAAYKVVT